MVDKKKLQKLWRGFPQNRKAQMQMMETIGVIFIFFILVLFGSIFYFKFQEISFQNTQEKLLAQHAMDVTLTSLYFPEIQCSRGVAEAEDNCVDLTKVRALTEVIQKNPRYVTDYYFNIFGYANISVEMIYPREESWPIYEFEKTEINGSGVEVPAWDRKEATYFVVTLRDELRGHGSQGSSSGTPINTDIIYGFGYLKVEVFS